jgi:hypothetical protein
LLGKDVDLQFVTGPLAIVAQSWGGALRGLRMAAERPKECARGLLPHRNRITSYRFGYTSHKTALYPMWVVVQPYSRS